MVSLVVIEYVCIPLTFDLENQWTLGRQFAILNIFTTSFIFITTISMLLAYVARIRGKLSYLVIENMNLLNKMHEGLIVLSESDLNLQFASLPAVRLIK